MTTSTISPFTRHIGISACFVISMLSLTASGTAAPKEAATAPPREGETFVPNDADRDRPIYMSSFDNPAALKDWRLEGGKKMSIANGSFILESGPGPAAGEKSKNHLVCWLDREVPADFLLEFTVRPQNRKEGLNIAFFSARGINGQGIFDPALSPRTGLYPQYNRGDINAYHVSYWAAGRETANMRKSKGFHLVAEGKDLVYTAPPDTFQKIGIYKRGGKIRVLVDDIVALAYDDDGQSHGPVLGSGWIGLRQMGHTQRCEYGEVSIYPLKPSSLAVAAPVAGQSTAVVPIDWSRFRGKPTDADSVQWETFVVNACKHGLGTWFDKEGNIDGSGSADYLKFSGRRDNLQYRPPAGMALVGAVVLATGIYDPAAVGLTEALARERVVKLIRSVARAHKIHGGNWGYEGPGVKIYNHIADPLVLAGWLMWNDLLPADREFFRRTIEAEADFFTKAEVAYYRDKSGKLIPSGDARGDTKAEELGWGSIVLGVAINMMPQHPSRDVWERKLFEVLLAGWARPSDVSSGEIYHGKPLSDWLNGSNINEAGTVNNHGIDPHPHYMASIVSNQHAVITYTLAGNATPKAALFNLEHVYRAMVEQSFAGKTIYTPGSAEVHFPAGNDKGSNEYVKYAYLDLAAREFGGDRFVTRKGAYWERLHIDKARDLQSRSKDGRSNLRDEEGGVGREFWIAQWSARAYLTKWIANQGYEFHNQGAGLVNLKRDAKRSAASER